MSRKPRLHVAGGLYHVILRGNGRRDIFFDADDRHRWESILKDELVHHQHRIHAYCWMTNHIHAAIQCGRDPLSQFMATLSSRYSKSTNKKLGRSGHLFERRYRAILVQEDSYILELVRYIHRNPLRAGLTDDPAKYQWSSHTAYLGGPKPHWLTVDWVLRVFGDTDSMARSGYCDFMQQDQDSTLLQLFRVGSEHDERALGDDSFVEAAIQPRCEASVVTNLDSVIATVCEKHDVTIDLLSSNSRERKLSRARAEIGFIARESGVATVSEVARLFGRSQAGLSRAVCKLAKSTKTSY